MSHSYYKHQFNAPWMPNQKVFTYKVMDLSIARAYSNNLYEIGVNILSVESKRLLFKDCANVAKLQANIAIKKMIASYDNKGDK